jgi:hypothetical protein
MKNEIMPPMPKQAEITEDFVDSILAINAAAGFNIFLIDELERKHNVKYNFKLKKYGNMFRDELLKSVNQVWLKGGEFDSEQISQQQMDTYLMTEQMFKMSLEVSRKLSPEQTEKFKLSFQNLLYSFKLELPTV